MSGRSCHDSTNGKIDIETNWRGKCNVHPTSMLCVGGKMQSNYNVNVWCVLAGSHFFILVDEHRKKSHFFSNRQRMSMEMDLSVFCKVSLFVLAGNASVRPYGTIQRQNVCVGGKSSVHPLQRQCLCWRDLIFILVCRSIKRSKQLMCKERGMSVFCIV
jgi:hypothetical protein